MKILKAIEQTSLINEQIISLILAKRMCQEYQEGPREVGRVQIVVFSFREIVVGILLNTCLMYTFHMQQTFFFTAFSQTLLCAMGGLRIVSERLYSCRKMRLNLANTREMWKVPSQRGRKCCESSSEREITCGRGSQGVQ